MIDGGGWNEPAEPGEGAPMTPVPSMAKDPEPVPLPPGAAGSGPRRKRLTAFFALAVIGFLLTCGLFVAGFVWFVSGGAPLPIFDGSADPSTGVMSSQWAGDGRYAVVEYAYGGTDATSSVIVWDSRTGETTKVDGFRLVSTEPSSTQVWLTRAVAASEVTEGASFDSPWNEPSWGPPRADGPGVAWIWDVEAPANRPVKVADPSWRPWTGPSGVTAALAVDPKAGLWPHSLTFGVESALVDAAVPAGMKTFRPAGWSPSGRYFAVVDDNVWSDTGRVAVFDAGDGRVVASYETTPGNDDSYEQLEGAVWDPGEDRLWVVTSNASGAEDVPANVFSLDTSGTKAPMRGVAHDPGKSVFGTTVIGRDPRGVLLFVQSTTDQTVWRISNGAAEKVGSIPGTYYGVNPLSYAHGQGILAQTDPESPTSAGGDSSETLLPERGTTAVLIGLDGTDPQIVWPQN